VGPTWVSTGGARAASRDCWKSDDAASQWLTHFSRRPHALFSTTS
jgi:hypothetical protein